MIGGGHLCVGPRRGAPTEPWGGNQFTYYLTSEDSTRQPWCCPLAISITSPSGRRPLPIVWPFLISMLEWLYLAGSEIIVVYMIHWWSYEYAVWPSSEINVRQWCWFICPGHCFTFQHSNYIKDILLHSDGYLRFYEGLNLDQWRCKVGWFKVHGTLNHPFPLSPPPPN